MPSRDRITPSYIQNKWYALAANFEEEWRRMLLVEAWRQIDKSVLKSEIWSGIAQQDWGNITIYKPTVASVNASAVALASSPRAKMIAKMKNRKSIPARDNANYLERVAFGMQNAINRYRHVPWEEEVTDHIFTRGAGIIKHGYLTPEERGERRVDIDENVALDLEDDQVIRDPETGAPATVDEEGEFPGFIEVIDPLDCVYVLGQGRQGVALFIHSYFASWDEIKVTFPDIEDMEIFSGLDNQPESARQAVQVYDYWDDTYRAIVVNGEFYMKPEAHGLDKLPFEVERVNEQTIRNQTRKMQNGQTGTVTAPIIKAVTPFPWLMVDSATWASFGESLLASYLPDMATTPIVHKGINSGMNGGTASPYFQRVQYSDGRISKRPRYMFRGDKTAGGRPVWPLFDGEDMFPLNPTPIADHLQIFIQQRNFDLELVGMNAELLSGRIRSEPSGFSVNQQTQLTSARMTPHVNHRDRLVSKGYTELARDLADNWDRDNVPLILTDLTEEEDVELTRDLVENVAEIVYQVDSVFPRDFQADMQLNLQLHAQGAMSRRQLIEEAGKAQDTDDEMKQIAWETVAYNDPTYLQALAKQRAEELGLGGDQPSPEAEQQAAMMQQAQMMQQQGQAGPPQEGGPPQQQNGQQGGNGQLPPEVMALLQAAGPPGPEGEEG